MASKAKKKKGGYKRSDWPRAGEGKVVRGFCQLHRSFFCPCAAPGIYETKRARSNVAPASVSDFIFKRIPTDEITRMRQEGHAMVRADGGSNNYAGGGGIEWAKGKVGEWVYEKLTGKSPDGDRHGGDFGPVNVKCVTYPRNPLLMVNLRNIDEDEKEGCRFYALIAWDEPNNTAAYIGHATMEEVRGAPVEDYGKGAGSSCHTLSWRALHREVPDV